MLCIHACNTGINFPKSTRSVALLVHKHVLCILRNYINKMCVPRLFRKESEPGAQPEISICAHKALLHALELHAVLLPVPAAGTGRMLCGGTSSALHIQNL